MGVGSRYRPVCFKRDPDALHFTGLGVVVV